MYIYVYVYICMYVCKTQSETKKKVGKESKYKKYVGKHSFILYQRSCMFLSSNIYKYLIPYFAYQNFVLEKYDDDNGQKLQPGDLLKKQCASGINLLGKPNYSSIF